MIKAIDSALESWYQDRSNDASFVSGVNDGHEFRHIQAILISAILTQVSPD